jgi:hypothetical protein
MIKCGNNKIRTQGIVRGSVYDLHPQDKTQKATLYFYLLIDLYYRILLFIGELRYVRMVINFD